MKDKSQRREIMFIIVVDINEKRQKKRRTERESVSIVGKRDINRQDQRKYGIGRFIKRETIKSLKNRERKLQS